MRCKAMVPFIAAMLAACSASSEDAARQTDASSDEPTVALPATPEPQPAPPPSPAPPPAKDADGCVTIQLPGHFEGEGLAKHYVPGPTTKVCDPPAVIAPATAEPYAPPIAATPAD